MLVFPPASERKLVPTVVMFGVFLEFINSRKSNNSFTLNLINLGKSSSAWFLALKHSIRVLNSLTSLSALFLLNSTMPLPPSTILRLGSLVTTLSENLFLAPTVLITNLVVWKFATRLSLPMRSNTFTCLMVPCALLRELCAVLLKTIRLKRVLLSLRSFVLSWAVWNLFLTTRRLPLLSLRRELTKKLRKLPRPRVARVKRLLRRRMLLRRRKLSLRRKKLKLRRLLSLKLKLLQLSKISHYVC
mmetsp:Transcript_53859/g.73822  ORF Transcript_53859/g.73822 Transcript_53859/m.73822 type:complete len:245 (+) Transcript_53859:159-893(+)